MIFAVVVVVLFWPTYKDMKLIFSFITNYFKYLFCITIKLLLVISSESRNDVRVKTLIADDRQNALLDRVTRSLYSGNAFCMHLFICNIERRKKIKKFERDYPSNALRLKK